MIKPIALLMWTMLLVVAASGPRPDRLANSALLGLVHRNRVRLEGIRDRALEMAHGLVRLPAPCRWLLDGLLLRPPLQDAVQTLNVTLAEALPAELELLYRLQTGQIIPAEAASLNGLPPLAGPLVLSEPPAPPHPAHESDGGVAPLALQELYAISLVHKDWSDMLAENASYLPHVVPPITNEHTAALRSHLQRLGSCALNLAITHWKIIQILGTISADSAPCHRIRRFLERVQELLHMYTHYLDDYQAHLQVVLDLMRPPEVTDPVPFLVISPKFSPRASLEEIARLLLDRGPVLEAAGWAKAAGRGMALPNMHSLQDPMDRSLYWLLAIRLLHQYQVPERYASLLGQLEGAEEWEIVRDECARFLSCNPVEGPGLLIDQQCALMHAGYLAGLLPDRLAFEATHARLVRTLENWRLKGGLAWIEILYPGKLGGEALPGHRLPRPNRAAFVASLGCWQIQSQLIRLKDLLPSLQPAVIPIESFGGDESAMRGCHPCALSAQLDERFSHVLHALQFIRDCLPDVAAALPLIEGGPAYRHALSRSVKEWAEAVVELVQKLHLHEELCPVLSVSDRQENLMAVLDMTERIGGLARYHLGSQRFKIPSAQSPLRPPAKRSAALPTQPDTSI